MTAKSLQLLPALLLLLLLHQNNCLACREVFTVDGHLPNSNSRGIFVSENFPHSLPAKSYCVYDFTVTLSYTSDVICFWFKELELFTVNEYSHKETEILIGGANRYESFLTYAGNGTLIREERDASRFVFLRPDSLLDGPICLRISYGMNRHLIAVVNMELYVNSLDRMTRFYAEYEAVDSGTLGSLEQSDGNTSFAGLHRCLDGSHVNRSLRCNAINDCGREGSESYRSDFFSSMSSDESYEHARCNSSRSFGTNFALGQASAHNLSNSAARLDCNMDHSLQFLSPDFRDCSLELRSNVQSSSTPVHYWLLGAKAAANPRSPACYRLFWLSADFRTDDEALMLAEPNGGRVLLRLPGSQRSYSWNLAEVQLEPGFASSYISVFTIQSGQSNQTAGSYWLDDLSAEPAACDESAFESHIPSVCSFEWSTCGWEMTNLPVVTDASVAKAFGVAVSDHTASSVPDRMVPPPPQQVLRLRPGIDQRGRLISRRRLPFGSSWCFEIWFIGVGYNGYSVRVEARISGIHPVESSLLRATVPINRWHRLSGSFISTIAKSPVMIVTLFAEDRVELLTVLFDDLGVAEGRCSAPSNGSVQCGSNEWSCSNRQQCILLRYRCDDRVHCNDASDEMDCIDAASGYAWSIILRVIIGVTVSIVAFLALSVCLHKRRLWWTRRGQTRENQRRMPPPRTVTNGRLPAGLRSDRTRRRPDMPPSYDEVAAGAANSGFAADEEPPKYDEIAQVMQIQQQQQQQQQQPPPRPHRVNIRPSEGLGMQD